MTRDEMQHLLANTGFNIDSILQNACCDTVEDALLKLDEAICAIYNTRDQLEDTQDEH